MAKRSEKFCDFRVFPNVMVKKKRNGVKFSIGCSASRHCEKDFQQKGKDNWTTEGHCPDHYQRLSIAQRLRGLQVLVECFFLCGNCVKY